MGLHRPARAGFALGYAARELWRRKARAVVTALGLATGVALVVTISGISQGLHQQQQKVLSPLSSVGTDVLVTRVAAPASSSSNGLVSNFFRGDTTLNKKDAAEVESLLQDNAGLVTDLRSLGKPGTTFTRDFFLPATLLTFPQQAVTALAKVDGVASVVGGLSLVATHQTGKVPKIVAQLQTGGQTLHSTLTPAPLSPAEGQTVRACLIANGVLTKSTSSIGFNSSIIKCLPSRYRQMIASFTVPMQTVQQVLAPPQTDIRSTTYTVAGVDPAHPDQGLVTRSQLTAGKWPAGPNEVLANTSYAARGAAPVGSTRVINGRTVRIVGLVSPTLNGQTADLYLPLATLQKLAGQPGRVNVVLLRARSAADVPTVAAQVQKLLPGAQIATAHDVAKQVTGSLVDAKRLTDRFGGAVAVIVIIAVFLIAVLITLSGVAKRVREIGTLRAIGWPNSHVLRQLLLETSGIGIIAAALGLGLATGVAALVTHLSPDLSATDPGVSGVGSSSYALFFDGLHQQAARVTHAHLSVPLSTRSLVLGVTVALVGGVLTGAIAGWRASRLSPAVALRDLG